jgi:hypothetical protein
VALLRPSIVFLFSKRLQLAGPSVFPKVLGNTHMAPRCDSSQPDSAAVPDLVKGIDMTNTKPMNMPGFNAEFALTKNAHVYEFKGRAASPGSLNCIIPQIGRVPAYRPNIFRFCFEDVCRLFQCDDFGGCRALSSEEM